VQTLFNETATGKGERPDEWLTYVNA